MNYIGSKLSLLEFLEESITKVVGSSKNKAGKNRGTFCDLFAGTGIVGSYFKKKGYKIISNDIQYYSFVLNKHYIGNHKELRFLELSKESPELKNIEIKKRKYFVCNYLSNLKGVKGFVFKNYCLGGTKNKKIQGDILYLDPPYNHRQYATNYHLLETIAKYDNPEIHGKTGLREYQNQKSLYCSRTKAKKAFKNLILEAKVKYIFLSYNNEGLMSLNDIKEIMSLRGKYGYFTKEYNRFKADKTENRNHKANKTVEYLHYVVCEFAETSL